MNEILADGILSMEPRMSFTSIPRTVKEQSDTSRGARNLDCSEMRLGVSSRERSVPHHAVSSAISHVDYAHAFCPRKA